MEEKNKILETLKTFLSYNKENFNRTPLLDHKNKTIQCDCSGIVHLLLKELGITSKKDKAYEIFEKINHSKFPYQKIENLEELLPGDIICWRKATIPNKGDTGHVAFIKEVLDKSANEVIIKVIDSTKTPHDNDTRKKGLGNGEMTFFIDKNTQVFNKFRWSKKIKKVKMTKIITGRILIDKH